MDQITDKMDQKLDRIDERLDQIDIKQAENNIHLQEHMRRTEANEIRLSHLEEIWERMKSHLDKVEGMMILFKWVGLSVGSIYTILQVLEYLKP